MMRTRQTRQIGQIGQIARRLTLVWGACLALALTLASCAGIPGASRVPATSTPKPGAGSTAQATASSSAFVCANPPGSHATYAYDGADGQVAVVKGCAAPIVVRAAAGRQFAPVAFSPTGKWLLAWDGATDMQDVSAQSCLALIAVSSGAVTPTKLCNPSPVGAPWSQWYSIIGWASDASFYLATTAQDASVTVSFVSLPQLTQAAVTKLTWVASVANADEPSGIALRGGALYYGGYMSTSEGGAWLHRFSLTTQTDTRSVRLGLAGSGGCQVEDVPCQWTGPWAISRDGGAVAYHAPGPTESISDTFVEANTPLFRAASDGSGAQRLFASQPLGQGFNRPAFSPDGRYIAATFAQHAAFERLSDGAVTVAPADLNFYGWAAQPGVAIMDNLGIGGAPYYILHLELYNVVTGARTPLQPGSRGYVWA